MSYGSLLRTCLICGKQFRAKPSQVSYGRAKHCSPTCQYLSNGRPRKTDIELLESLLPFGKGCLLWLGAANKAGYGLTPSARLRGEKLIHRFFWRLQKGPIPLGLHVLHSCDVRRCCNIEHLFLGTQKDNNDDMVRKQRRRCWGHIELTPSQRIEIAQRRINGENREKIAREYGISPSYVRDLVKKFPELTPQIEDLRIISKALYTNH